MLEVHADAIEQCDERTPSFVDSVLQAFTFGVPEANYAPPLVVPSYDELREAEADVIREITARQNAVIVGRGGFHWLSEHPRHLSIFLHAETEFRVRRVQAIYSLSCERALQVIDESDRARGRYLRELTGRMWTDTVQYDVCLDTSSLGLMLAGRILVELVRLRFRCAGKNDGAQLP
jgi:cytidylate kinase